jgi:hypothetical protein
MTTPHRKRTRGRADVIGIGAAAVVVLVTTSVYAVHPLVEVGGGSSRPRDCFATIKANANKPANRPRHVRCTDGDPACDADATVDGVCTFVVQVCANSTLDPAFCTPSAISAINVAHAVDNGADPGFHPEYQALQALVDTEIAPPTAAQNVCTSTANIRVRIRGPFAKPPAANHRCRPNKRLLDMFTSPDPLEGQGDKDVMKLICDPDREHPDGCSPTAHFTGTFDRLERQIFAQSCALGTCHDSQSFTNAGGLLLEQGAAYTNLINVDPQNTSAAGIGWDRVTSGDSSLSFLYHKVIDDLDEQQELHALPGIDPLGLRMPRPPGRPRLHKSLQEIIRLWIDAGAPALGWVPGTD